MIFMLHQENVPMQLIVILKMKIMNFVHGLILIRILMKNQFGACIHLMMMNTHPSMVSYQIIQTRTYPAILSYQLPEKDKMRQFYLNI